MAALAARSILGASIVLLTPETDAVARCMNLQSRLSKIRPKPAALRFERRRKTVPNSPGLSTDGLNRPIVHTPLAPRMVRRIGSGRQLTP